MQASAGRERGEGQAERGAGSGSASSKQQKPSRSSLEAVCSQSGAAQRSTVPPEEMPVWKAAKSFLCREALKPRLH